MLEEKEEDVGRERRGRKGKPIFTEIRL